MNSFKRYVETSTAPDSEKLQMLIHSCSSNIRNILNPFTRMKSSEGYRKALSTLKDRYGEEDAHIEELLMNLINGPPVKITNGEGLQDLADELQACICSFQSMDSQETLEHLLVKKGIIDRLLGLLQERCEIAVLDHPPKRYGHMKIRDIWQFIQSRAKEAKMTHTRYTNLGYEGKDRSSKQAMTLVTNDVGERDCPLCHSPHRLPQCSNFRKLTKMEKRNTVKELGYCFLCLRGRHQASNCMSGFRPCDIDGCGKAHSRWLHLPKEGAGVPPRKASGSSRQIIKSNRVDADV
ncbi:uncharacterized protein LOC121855859 [Homarus americanus]|uniref:Uncharacterized protein n=1 Tax=Homarus americanus TaxID=6706 RepID=A0A8J5MKP2_HOMAM|nr:uncharacterized protein LOC121855859 [Homarus americanus]KAG7154760.1 hypothetical protein Hamer_G027693 [Homarus americanus]